MHVPLPMGSFLVNPRVEVLKRMVVEGGEEGARQLRVGGKQLRRFLLTQILLRESKMRIPKFVYSQILGVICIRTAIPTKLVVHRPCGKPVTGGVERHFMQSSSRWLIDFAFDRKSHEHVVCNLALVLA